ncbi:MAG: undecaprenyl-phosphate glucose phosphotransferase [Chloroflexi bacterium]|nr:undecaprenyl-phosphate glucose phosphotransferase [Chloroflexota bacterium]
MRRPLHVWRTAALLAADVAAIWLAYVAAHWLRFGSALLLYKEFQPWSFYAPLAVAHALVTVFLLALSGMYGVLRDLSLTAQVFRLVAAGAIGAGLANTGGAVLSGETQYSELLLALAWLASLGFMGTARLVVQGAFAWLRALGFDTQRVLIVGTNEVARTIAERIQQSPGLGYRLVGFARPPGDGENGATRPVLGDADQLRGIVGKYRVDEVIIAIPSLSRQEALDLIARCDDGRTSIRIFPDVFQIMTSGVAISDLGGMPLVSVRDLALKGYNLAVKRGMDFALSTAALILLSGPLLLIALLVKLTSPTGGVFYSQERVGLDGRPFQIIKFRTMRPDAEEQTGPVWATPDDRRTTWLGRILRRLSIDELPQLINVLVGEMSLVGPRPERPHFVEQFKALVPRYGERHREKAGITGWAQVHGLRGNTPITERTAYDLWYVENWTPWLDIKIMLRSLIIIFRDKNAY